MTKNAFFETIKHDEGQTETVWGVMHEIFDGKVDALKFSDGERLDVIKKAYMVMKYERGLLKAENKRLREQLNRKYEQSDALFPSFLS